MEFPSNHICSVHYIIISYTCLTHIRRLYLSTAGKCVRGYSREHMMHLYWVRAHAMDCQLPHEFVGGKLVTHAFRMCRRHRHRPAPIVGGRLCEMCRIH